MDKTYKKEDTFKRVARCTNCQSNVAIYIDFSEKSPLKDPNRKKLMNKNPKINFKIEKYEPILDLKNIIRLAKLCGINFIKLYIEAALIKNSFTKTSF